MNFVHWYLENFEESAWRIKYIFIWKWLNVTVADVASYGLQTPPSPQGNPSYIWSQSENICFCPFILINIALFSLSHTCSHSENTFCSLPYSLFHSTTQKYNNTFPICKAFAFNPPNFRTFYFHFLDLKAYLLAGSIIEDLFINSHLPEQKVCRNVLPHFFWPHNWNYSSGSIVSFLDGCKSTNIVSCSGFTKHLLVVTCC